MLHRILEILREISVAVKAISERLEDIEELELKRKVDEISEIADL